MPNPIKDFYVALGEGKGMKITLYPNSMVIERKEKKEGKWETPEKVTLGIKVLEFLAARLPALIVMIEAQKQQ